MSLTRKQKRTVKSHVKKLTLKDLAAKTKASPDEIVTYIQKVGLDNEITYESSSSFAEHIKSQTKKVNKKWFESHMWVFIGLGLLVFGLYANGLNSEFVSDDKVFITHPEVLSLSFISQYPFGILRSLLYIILYNIFGLSALAFRTSSVVFHMVNVWIVFVLLFVMGNRKIALITALLFAVHPILTESITWISGGVYPHYGLFILLGTLLYLFSLNSKKYLWYSLISFTIAMLISERAIFFPFILILLNIILKTLKKNKKIISIVISIGFVIVLLLTFLVRERLFMLAKDAYLISGMDNPFVLIPVAIFTYVKLLLWPSALTLYQTEIAPTTAEYVVEVIFFSAFIAGIVYSYKKSKFVFFWLMFFIITLSPYLTPFQISWVVAERYVYLGSIGIISVFAYGVLYLTKRYSAYRDVIVSMVIIAAIVLSVRTIVRNRDWQNEDTLWIATVKASPSSPNAHNNIGDYYVRNDDLENAALSFQKAIDLKPNYADAYHNLGNVFQRMGRFEDAKLRYQKALEISPYLWQSHVQLADIAARQQDFKTAEEELSKALSISPDNPEILTSFAIFYIMTNDSKMAETYAKKALSINPQDKRAMGVLQKI